MSIAYKQRRANSLHPSREQLGGPRSKRFKENEAARRERRENPEQRVAEYLQFTLNQTLTAQGQQ
jgi:hypothetical protein